MFWTVFSHRWTNFRIFPFPWLIYLRITNHTVALSFSLFNSYKQRADKHFRDEILRHNIWRTADRNGVEPLLLLNSRLAIKSFAFLRNYYLRNTNHTVAGFFLSWNLTLVRKRPTHISSTNFWSRTEKVKNRCSCNFQVWLISLPAFVRNYFGISISCNQQRRVSSKSYYANDWLLVYNVAKLMLPKRQKKVLILYDKATHVGYFM